MDKKNHENLVDRVIKAVAAALRMSVSEITAETFFIRDLNVESIDFLDIAFEIEKETGREVAFKEIAQKVRARSPSGTIDFQIREVAEHLEGLGT